MGIRAPIDDNRAMKRTVLIVDDHAGFRASARRVLEAERLLGDRRGGRRQLRRDGGRRSPSPTWPSWTCSCRTSTASRSPGGCGNRGEAPEIVLISSHERADFGSLVETSGARGFVSKADLSAAALEALLR